MAVFRWRHFAGEIILWAVRWYCRYGISYRELEEMMGERGVAVDHTTVYRWTQRYAPELEKRSAWYRSRLSFSWRVDETYVRVKGRWKYLYRAIHKEGATLDFYLADRRDAKAARRFLAKALRRSRDWTPRVINTDKNLAYGEAIAELKKEGRLPKDTQHRYRWEPGGVVTPQIDTQASADGTTDWTVVVTDTQAAVGLRASSGL